MSCIEAAVYSNKHHAKNNSELVDLMKSMVPKLPEKPSVDMFTPIVCCVCNNLCNEVLTCQSINFFITLFIILCAIYQSFCVYIVCNKSHFICRLCRPYLCQVSTGEEEKTTNNQMTNNKVRLTKCCIATVFCALQTSKEKFFT